MAKKPKNCLFWATNIVKESDKEKYVISVCEITLDSAGSLNVDNYVARNFKFGVDSSLPSHSDSCKNKFLILGAGPSNGLNGSVGSPEEKCSTTLLDQIQTVFWVHIIMLIIVICLLMEKKIKADNKSVNYPARLCLGSISNRFSNT